MYPYRKCICYEITEIVLAHFLQCRGAILRNILYKIHKYIIYTTGISYRDDTLSIYKEKEITYSLLNNLYVYINMIHEKEKPHKTHTYIEIHIFFRVVYMISLKI